MKHRDLPEAVYLRSSSRRPWGEGAFDEVCQAVIDSAPGWYFNKGPVGPARPADLRWYDLTADGAKAYLAAGRAAGAVAIQVEWEDLSLLLEDAARWAGALRALGGGPEYDRELIELADRVDERVGRITDEPDTLWRVRMRWTAGGQSAHFQSEAKDPGFLDRSISRARLAVGEELLEDENAAQLLRGLSDRARSALRRD